MLKQSVELCLFYYPLPPLVVALEPCARKELAGFKGSATQGSLGKVAEKMGEEYRVRLQRLETGNPRSLVELCLS